MMTSHRHVSGCADAHRMSTRGSACIVCALCVKAAPMHVMSEVPYM